MLEAVAGCSRSSWPFVTLVSVVVVCFAACFAIGYITWRRTGGRHVGERRR